nr:hypothetical protein [Ardenticatena sp.]
MDFSLFTPKHWMFIISVLVFLNVVVYGCFLLFWAGKLCFGC